MPVHDEWDAKTGKRSHFRLIVIIAVIAVVILAAWGILSRLHHSHALKKQTRQASVLVVNVIHPQAMTSGSDIVLPGNIHAWHEATLSARVTGYLKAWHKDIGDRVKAGDLLAEIDTPETDRQLEQADADLKLAIANSELAEATAKRWLILVKSDSVTRQETDEKVADARAKAATVLSQTASRDRLRELETFKRIVAPFDGLVTARSTDIGALISDSGGGELYHIASTDQLRVYVNVPENYASKLASNVTAELHFAEHPGEIFKARLLNDAASIDPASRTLLAQFVLDNPQGRLFPGGFCEVHLKSPQAQPTLRLPINAFMFQDDGLQVAVLDQNNKISLRSVTAGRDFGKSIEVVAGLSAQDNVVVNPPDSLYSGETVRIAPPAKQDGGVQQQEADDEKAKEPAKKEDGDNGDSTSENKDKDAQSQQKKPDADQDKDKQDNAPKKGSDGMTGAVKGDTDQQDENSRPLDSSSQSDDKKSSSSDNKDAGKAGGDDDKQAKDKGEAKDKKPKSKDPNSKDDAK